MRNDDDAYLTTFAEPGEKYNPQSYLDSMFVNILFDEDLRNYILTSREANVSYAIRDEVERARDSFENIADINRGVSDDGRFYYFKIAGDTNLDDIEALLEDRVEDDRREKRSALDGSAESVDGWVFLERADDVPYPTGDNAFGMSTTDDLVLLEKFLEDRVDVKRPKKQVELVDWEKGGILAFESYEAALNSDTLKYSGISDADIVGVVAKGPKLVFDYSVLTQLSDFFTQNAYDPNEVMLSARFYEERARAKWKRITQRMREEDAAQLQKELADAKKKDAMLTSLVKQFWDSASAMGTNKAVFCPYGWVASRRTRKNISTDLRAKR